MAALGLGQATGGNNGRRNLKLQNCSWSLELMSKPKLSVQTTSTPDTLYILSVCQTQLQGHLGDVGSLASDEEKM
jgi:hypothetical protein